MNNSDSHYSSYWCCVRNALLFIFRPVWMVTTYGKYRVLFIFALLGITIMSCETVPNAKSPKSGVELFTRISLQTTTASALSELEMAAVLISDLGAESYETRQLATSRLKEFGQHSLVCYQAMIMARQKTDDLEVRDRLDQILPDLHYWEMVLYAQRMHITDVIRQIDLGNGVTLSLTLIPHGRFMMGSCQTEGVWQRNDETQHEVTLTKPFYMGITEVTRGQFASFVRNSGYKTDAEKDGKGGDGYDGEKWIARAEYNWRNIGIDQTDNHPVVNVTWYDAVAFCQWLSKKESRQFRLPTEAEWEYACRSGVSVDVKCGDGDEDMYKYGNYCDESNTENWAWQDKKHNDGEDNIAKVGIYLPNTWGLYDMRGNVQEWCQDWYGEYGSAAVSNPIGVQIGETRIVRGGCWYAPLSMCLPTRRSRLKPNGRDSGVGFRVILELAE